MPILNLKIRELGALPQSAEEPVRLTSPCPSIGPVLRVGVPGSALRFLAAEFTTEQFAHREPVALG
jgi:hypothetical protein